MQRLRDMASEELAGAGLSPAERQAFAPMLAEVVARLLSENRRGIGGPSPGLDFKATQKRESVKLSTRSDNDCKRGRAATTDCVTQLKVVTLLPPGGPFV